jgi:hypothetical protein
MLREIIFIICYLFIIQASLAEESRSFFENLQNAPKPFALQIEDEEGQVNHSKKHEDLERLRKVLLRTQLASLAYVDDEVIRKHFPDVSIHITRKSKIKFFVMIDLVNAQRLIAIRGNANDSNWMISLQVELARGFLGDIAIHSGFLDGALEVFEDGGFEKVMKEKAIRQSQDVSIPLKNVLVGHSMGGAIAILLAKKMEMAGHEIDEVVTFAQPMVTDEAGAKELSSLPIIRITNVQDLVTYLPTVELGYRHIGEKLELGKEGYRFLSNSDEDNVPWVPPEEREIVWDQVRENPAKLSFTINPGDGGISCRSTVPVGDLVDIVIAHSLLSYISILHKHINGLRQDLGLNPEGDFHKKHPIPKFQ